MSRISIILVQVAFAFLLANCGDTVDIVVIEPEATDDPPPVTAECAVGRGIVEHALTTPNDAIEVNRGDFDPQASTVFERLLSKLPDNDVVSAHVRLVDLAGFAESQGYLLVDPGSSRELIESHMRCVAGFDNFLINRLIAGWPTELREYQFEVDSYPALGFNAFSANQYASTGGRYGIVTADAPNYDLAFGAFDPDDTSRRLQICECDQPEVRSHLGIEYFVWGAEHSFSNRLRPPLYDHLGRGPELLVREGEAYYSVSDGAVADFIDVIQGEVDALAVSDDHVNVVRWSAGLGTLGEVSIRDRGYSISEVEAHFRDTVTAGELQDSQPTMGEIDLVAIGIGAGDEGIFGSIVLSHPGDIEAADNEVIFLKRLDNVKLIALGVQKEESWSSVINKIDIQSTGRFLIVRVYFHDPRDTVILGVPNNLILTR